MNRKYIIDAITTILEDIFKFKMSLPFSEEFDAFFEADQFEEFCCLVTQEFELADDTLIDSCSTFRELVALIEDEVFP